MTEGAHLPWGCCWGCPCPLRCGVLSPGTCRTSWLLQAYSLWFISSCHLTPLPKAGLDSKQSACQYRRLKFDPWVRKIPQRREWQPTPVFLPGESHGQRSLMGYSPWGGKELDMTEQLTHTPKAGLALNTKVPYYQTLTLFGVKSYFCLEFLAHS